MKKWIVWFLMIPICAVALNSFYNYIMFTPLENNMEATALLIFIPIFGLICLCNIMVHLYALIIGIIKRKNTNFLRLNSFIQRGILKWIGLVFIMCYSWDLYMVLKTENINGIIWNLLAILVTLFYVSWFNTFNCICIKKEVVLC